MVANANGAITGNSANGSNIEELAKLAQSYQAQFDELQ